METVSSAAPGVTVRFSAAELTETRRVAVARRARHRRAGHASLWVDNGDDPHRTETLGLLAERAAAYVLGIAYDLARDAAGSGLPYDLAAGTVRIEVKYADGPRHRLIFAARNPFKPDVQAAVLVVPAGDDCLRVVGYTTHDNFDRHMVARDFGHGFGPELTLDQDRLFPIAELVAAVETARWYQREMGA